MQLNHNLLSVGLLALVTPAFAQLPYNPTRIIPIQDGSAAYLFQPQPSSSQFTFSYLDTSKNLNSTSTSEVLLQNLPFLKESSPKAFITLPDTEGITVLAGDCQNATDDFELWRFTRNDTEKNGTWNSMPVGVSDSSLSTRYLSAAFTFSQTASVQDAALYVFGGMCPNGTADASNWTSKATYSNTMLTLASASSSSASQYQISLTGSRAPPIPEAGLSITPLTPTYSNTSDGNVSQQQNFILLGGHTQAAFINMSQLAIFSLPQSSWAFVGVDQPSVAGQRLKTRDVVEVEPRSGHTAVLTPDGSKIIVLGGWVGDVSNPAEPQLAILELGQGFGGQGDWAWTIPTVTDSPFAAGHGIYGHGAAMLSGDVMVVAGGHSISTSASKIKRATSSNLLFLNTTTFSWTTTYTNPYPSGTSPGTLNFHSTSSGLKASEKAGLGAGLGLGIAAAIAVAVVWLIHSRKLREKRALREKELRALALGAERLHTPIPPTDGDGRYAGMRTASWNATQEQQIEGSGNPWPWAPVGAVTQNRNVQGSDHVDRADSYLERSDSDGGLRRSFSSRGPTSLGGYPLLPPPGVPGGVFRIDEEDESSQAGSVKRVPSPSKAFDRHSVVSDPFKDPPNTADSSQADPAAQRRQKEVDGWVEDWQSAAETMSISRNTSHAHSRTYSNLSQFRANNGGSSGRGSPEKSDRTGSNLSDKSMPSVSEYSRSGQTTGTISRNLSQRSVSAGYALFAGAAAAMGRMTGSRAGDNETEQEGRLARAPSNRSVSFNVESLSRDRDTTFASARSPWGAARPGENQSLLNRHPHKSGPEERQYQTVGESSPSKDKYSRAGSLTGSGRKAMNLFGSVKRVFTGTGSVDVQDRVANLEQQSGQSSPTKHSGLPEMAETLPRRSLSAGASFWRGKQGPKDWSSDNGGPSSSFRRGDVPGVVLNDERGELGDEYADWDVETAVQQRVVQVMFTVPKEKLRVVNADALSLLSSNRSEVDHEEDKERDQMKRMSSVREGDEDYDLDDTTSTGKGKGKAQT